MKKKCITAFIMLFVLFSIFSYCSAFTLPTLDIDKMTISTSSENALSKYADSEDTIPFYQTILYKFVFPICALLSAVFFARAAIKKKDIKIIIALAVVLVLTTIATVVGSIIIHF